jgi:low temperature requirement protein LtrA
MDLLQKTFRLWWQKPKRIADIEDEREVSFLELFYDLAYVVIVIQLTHLLAGHLELHSVIQYVGLYALVWFAWINGSWYHELHGNNDIRSRVFTFIQMFFLLWMGIFIHAMGDGGYQGFALAYAGFLATLTYLWWRTGVHDVDHRPMSNPYSVVFVFATAAFVYSITLSALEAQIVWFTAALGVLFLPLLMMYFRRAIDPEHVEQAQRVRPSLAERFGLLTIIVLGENLISIVGGATYVHHLSWETIIPISLAIVIVFSLWWIYFDLISRRLPMQTMRHRMSWMYLHLPLTMSIGLVAVGLLNMIEHTEYITDVDRWFVLGPVALFLVTVSLLTVTLEVKYEENRPIYRKSMRVALVSALLLVLVGFVEWSLVATLVVTWLLLTMPVLAGIRMWIRRRYEEELRKTN